MLKDDDDDEDNNNKYNEFVILSQAGDVTYEHLSLLCPEAVL